MKEKNMLKVIEGKLFYSKTYKEYVVVIDGALHTADLKEYIKEPNDAQIDILVADLASYMNLTTAIKNAEDTIEKFGLESDTN